MSGTLESFRYEESESTSRTNSTDWHTKLEVDFTPGYTGSFLLDWKSEVQIGEPNSREKPHIVVRVIIDDSVVVNEFGWGTDMPGHWASLSGMKKYPMTKDQDVNIKIQFHVCPEEPGFVGMRRTRMLLSSM